MSTPFTENPPLPISRRLRARLSDLAPRALDGSYLSEAAVLMPIFERDGIPHFLLTRRTEEVQTHKGQISFPGGMRHAGETLEATALRETFEEVGIRGEQVEILGQYHDYLSSTDNRVTPFAGYIGDTFLPRPQVTEVAEILYVPFDVFMDPARLRTERWIRRGRELEVYFYRYGTHEIWGLTARIIKDFLADCYLNAR